MSLLRNIDTRVNLAPEIERCDIEDFLLVVSKGGASAGTHEDRDFEGLNYIEVSGRLMVLMLFSFQRRDSQSDQKHHDQPR